MNNKICSICHEKSRWIHYTLQDCIAAQSKRIEALEKDYAALANIVQQCVDLANIVQQCVEKLEIGKTPMAMKRIVRNQRLTPEEVAKYNKIRDQVAQELPDLIARHIDRMDSTTTAADEAANKLSDELEKSLKGFISVGVTGPTLIIYIKNGLRRPKNLPSKYEGYLVKVSYIQTPRPSRK